MNEATSLKPADAPCINGHRIPQYYSIKGIFAGAAPRSGSTSLYMLYKQTKDEGSMELDYTPQTATCIVRHPIKRLASAWLLLPEEMQKIDGERIAARPQIEDVIDAILGDHAGAFFTDKIGNSNHAYAWMRQSELYAGVEWPEWIRLEGIESFHRHVLPHYNVAEAPKPEITHRLDELLDYYKEDLELWEAAPTKI